MKKWVPYPSEKFSTLIELLRLRASTDPERRAYTFLLDGESEETHLTYGGLDRRARSVGAWLQAQGAQGARVLLLYPPGLEFISGFFGCLYAGAVAVPAYPPRLNQNLLRLQAIAADSQAMVALTTPPIMSRVAPLCAQDAHLAHLRWKAFDAAEQTGAGDWRDPRRGSHDLAFFQYTSGSTGAPKGVMLTHDNLLHNAALVHHAMEHTAEDKYVSWLPTFHDMGFMAGVLQPLYAGIPAVLMSPASFLQRPLRWLQSISRHRGTTSGAPNFAYELCVNRITPEQKAALDLSSWSAAFNGAEPVRHETVKRFAEVFAPCGFREEVFYPCYGLAEATLIVSGGSKSAPPVIKAVRSSGLENNLVADGAGVEGEERRLVGCGAALPGQRITVVNPEELTECEPGRVGEIWTAGRSVARGYWNRPEETEATFQAHLSDTSEGPFLRTGDLGFLDGGELFVTGRLKDMIIIRGLNHYPQDIELTAEKSHTALRPGCGAAFSVTVNGEERLVVVHELELRQGADAEEVLGAVREAVAAQHELQTHAVVLIKPGSLPKTSSGKIQRGECRARFQAGTLNTVAQWREQARQETAAEAAPPASERGAAEIEKWLVSQFASRLSLSVALIDATRPVSHYCLDSLAAVELAHHIESGLGVALPATGFLQDVTIRQLAARVESELSGGAHAPRETEVSAGREVGEHPLSYGQQAMWFLYTLSPESPAYNIAVPLRVRSEVDAGALRHAFQQLVDRHATLRTTFSAPHGEPLAVVHEQGVVDFRQVDAGGWDDSHVDEKLTEEAHRPFDLENGPLLRVRLYRRSVNEHVLMLTVHHIAADFWSLTVLMSEMAAVYRALKGARTAQFAPPPLQYTDFARWQQRMLDGPRGERLFGYWEKQLAGELPVLDLMTDRPRPSEQTFRGAAHLVKVDAELTARLKELSQSCGATLYMTLLAAFQVLLHRHTGQEDVLVGTPTAGRTQVRVANVVGYFVNPVVMRGDLSGRPTFTEFLSRTRRTVLDALEHQEYPFPLLVKRLQPGRDASRSPLFQAMFILQRAHLLGDAGASAFALGAEGARMTLGGLELESVSLKQRVAPFDLTLSVVEEAKHLSACFEYNADLFDRATVERMTAHLMTLLGAIAGDPERHIDDLPLLTAEERRRVLVEWNATPAAAPAHACLSQMFEAQVERTPAAVALVHAGERLTYRELNERANRLAHQLRALGVGANTLVGVMFERSVEMVVGLLAVTKAGGAYVPLDASHPRERLSFILEESAVAVLLTTERLKEALPRVNAAVLCVDGDRERIAAHSSADPRVETAPDDLAYVIYTSGSTGRPKGVMIPHRGLVNYLGWAAQAYAAAAGAGAPVHSPLGFDLTVTSLLLPLVSGGRAVLLGEGEGSEELSEVLCGGAGERTDEGEGGKPFSLVKLTPAHLEVLSRLPGAQTRSGTRAFIIGGEALSGSSLRFWRERWPELRLINEYGPTETVVGCCVYEARDEARRAVPIGRPIWNTRLYVLAGRQQVVPAGVAGELYIGGEGLARGYLNRPALTAERFVPDPFSGEPGARLYRTGDLVRHLPDGNLEFIGRVDHQVKVRGFRIELGEIDAALEAHPAVEAAVAAAREDVPGDKRLVAYVVNAREASLTLSEMRDHLKELLPEYMIPAALVTLPAMPLTSNGKVDRRALPAPRQQERAGVEGNFVGARTLVEELLVTVWGEVLGVEQVGVHDNFFDLGGHSLLATQMISRLRDVLEVSVPLRSIFSHPTVAGLAAVVEEALIEQITESEAQVPMLEEE